MKSSCVALFLSIALISGCTTATYGIRPAPVAAQPDTFTFKIFTGGFAGGDTADKRAAEELDKYKNANGYASYTILDKHYQVLPSGFVYTVRFSR
ncbi:MAG TPA: hypothetical protein VGH80_13790 [Xanthomonadaceae bacterium]|jgi:hypothetical protein